MARFRFIFPRQIDVLLVGNWSVDEEWFVPGLIIGLRDSAQVEGNFGEWRTIFTEDFTTRNLKLITTDNRLRLRVRHGAIADIRDEFGWWRPEAYLGNPIGRLTVPEARPVVLALWPRTNRSDSSGNESYARLIQVALALHAIYAAPIHMPVMR